MLGASGPVNKTYGGFSFASATQALLRHARPSAHPSGPALSNLHRIHSDSVPAVARFLARAALRSAIHSFCCVACHGVGVACHGVGCHGRRQWSCAGPLPDAGQLRICLTMPRMSSLWWRWPSTSMALISLVLSLACRWWRLLSFCHPGSSGVRLTPALGPP